MRRVTHYALIFALLTTHAFNAIAQVPIVIKFSHDVSATSPKGLAIQRLKEVSEKITHGRIRIDIYPSNTLFQDKDELEALQLGAIQMSAPALTKLSGLGLREFDVFELPYLFPDSNALHRITQGSIGRDLFKKLDTKSIVGLGYWDSGFKDILSTKPLHQPADLHGLKMQGPPSKVIETQIITLGAIPRLIPAADVMQSLRHGAIDAAENVPSVFYDNKPDSSHNYLTLTEHGYIGYAIVVNKKFWDGLPAELRSQLTSAINETGNYANQLARQKNDLDVAAMTASGKTTVIRLTAAQKAQWRQVLLPVQTEMGTRIGKELIDNINKTLQEAQTH